MTNARYDAVTMEELFSQDINGTFPLLVDIKYGNDSHIYIINDTSSVIFNGHKYEPASFSIGSQKSDGKTISDITFTMPTIDNRVKQIIDSIDNMDVTFSINALFVKFVNNGNERYQFHPMSNLVFTAVSVTDNGTSGTWNLVYKHVLSLNVPKDLATEQRFPSAK